MTEPVTSPARIIEALAQLVGGGARRALVECRFEAVVAASSAPVRSTTVAQRRATKPGTVAIHLAHEE